jgi:NTE family protein
MTTRFHRDVWRDLKAGTRSDYLLALQGGGTFGAFSAGVLCRLLEDPSFPLPTRISGTSAGALNAVVLADALIKGKTPAEKRALAIKALKRLWDEDIPRVTMTQLSRFLSNFWADITLMHLPVAAKLELLNNVFDLWVQTYRFYGGPVYKVPASANPLRELVRHVDFAALRATTEVRLYIATTEATDPTKGRVFTNADLTADVVVASGALPDLFEPVTIGGTAYMEGGYVHNPPIVEPIRDGATTVVLVRLNSDTFNPPKTSFEAEHYTLAATFNQPLKRDIAWLNQLNASTPKVAAFDLGLEGHHGFTPPQKRRVSVPLIQALFATGTQVAAAALAGDAPPLT